MPGIKEVTNLWNSLKELDLRPIAAAAVQETLIAIVGASGVGKATLADQLRSDPARVQVRTLAPIAIADLSHPERAADANLVILMIAANARESLVEQELAREWTDAGKPVLVFYNKLDILPETQRVDRTISWGRAMVLYGSATDRRFLESEFASAVMALLPDRHLSLARNLPLLRLPISRALIAETCTSNAMYALSTGLAEIVPIFDVPFNIADVIILTKSQALLVYKLGLALGLSSDWQEHMAEFGGVIGGGFVWRQVARQLVGLVPVWGIVPKVAVAYAGTFVVGNTVLQWYLTGRHITRDQVRELYHQAMEQGRSVAKRMIARAPRPRVGRKPRLALPVGRKKSLCANCGKANESGAHYCQNCGQALATIPTP